jgi:hypothetical protein
MTAMRRRRYAPAAGLALFRGEFLLGLGAHAVANH